MSTILLLPLLAACSTTPEPVPADAAPSALRGCEMTTSAFAVDEEGVPVGDPYYRATFGYDDSGWEVALWAEVDLDGDGALDPWVEQHVAYDEWDQSTWSWSLVEDTLEESTSTYDGWKILEWVHDRYTVDEASLSLVNTDIETRAWSFTDNSAALFDYGADGGVDETHTYRSERLDDGWLHTTDIDEYADGRIDRTYLTRTDDQQRVVEAVTEFVADGGASEFVRWERGERGEFLSRETGVDDEVHERCTYEYEGRVASRDVCDDLVSGERTVVTYTQQDGQLQGYTRTQGPVDGEQPVIDVGAYTWSCHGPSMYLARAAGTRPAGGQQPRFEERASLVAPLDGTPALPRR